MSSCKCNSCKLERKKWGCASPKLQIPKNHSLLPSFRYLLKDEGSFDTSDFWCSFNLYLYSSFHMALIRLIFINTLWNFIRPINTIKQLRPYYCGCGWVTLKDPCWRRPSGGHLLITHSCIIIPLLLCTAFDMLWHIRCMYALSLLFKTWDGYAEESVSCFVVRL